MQRGDISNVTAPEIWVQAELLIEKTGKILGSKYRCNPSAIDWLVRLSKKFRLLAVTLDMKKETHIRTALIEHIDVVGEDSVMLARKLDRDENIAKVYVRKEDRSLFPMDTRVVVFSGWGEG